MRTQVKNYTFTAGTRQITVTDNISFTKADIAIIVNRTQQKVLFTIPDYNLITDVANKVITYDNSLPVLAEGDVLWIEIDIEVSAQKIVYTPGDITVTPIQGQPDYYHDLAYEIAQWPDLDYPYCMALLLQGETTEFYLSGASKYKTSDGQIYSSDQYITIETNTDATKRTKYVIFRYATPFVTFDTSNYPNTPSIARKILMMYNYNISTANIGMANTSLMYAINDEALQNPIVYNGVRTMTPLKSYGFQNSHLEKYICPGFRTDATTIEKDAYTIPPYCFAGSLIRELYLPAAKTVIFETYAFNNSKLKHIEFNENTEEIEFRGKSFVNAEIVSINWPTSLRNVKAIASSNMSFTGDIFAFPAGLEIISLGDAFFNGSEVQHFILKKASVSYNGGTQPFYSCAPRIVELENNWPHSQIIGSVSNFSAANMTAASLETYTLNRLIDLKTVQGRIPYIKTIAGALTVWVATDNTGATLDSLGDSAKFTTIFRVGETVIVNIAGANRNYNILSIDSDNQMTMTNSNYMVAGTYLLNHNKVLTLTSVLLTLLSTAQKAIATNKLWQLI